MVCTTSTRLNIQIYSVKCLLVVDLVSYYTDCTTIPLWQSVLLISSMLDIINWVRYNIMWRKRVTNDGAFERRCYSKRTSAEFSPPLERRQAVLNVRLLKTIMALQLDRERSNKGKKTDEVVYEERMMPVILRRIPVILNVEWTKSSSTENRVLSAPFRLQPPSFRRSLLSRMKPFWPYDEGVFIAIFVFLTATLW